MREAGRGRPSEGVERGGQSEGGGAREVPSEGGQAREAKRGRPSEEGGAREEGQARETGRGGPSEGQSEGLANNPWSLSDASIELFIILCISVW